MRERVALVMMSMIGRNHLDGNAPWSTGALARALHMPSSAIDELLVALQSHNILATTSDEPPGWLPARDLGEVNASELLAAVRTVGEEQSLNAQALPVSEAVGRVLNRCHNATEAALRGVTAKDLAGTPPEPPNED